MSKNKTPIFDDENPEWTEKEFSKAIKPDDILPEAVLKAFPKTMKRLGRPLKENKKNAIYIRLSPDVLDYFKSKGSGWQTKIDDVLKQWVTTHPQ